MYCRNWHLGKWRFFLNTFPQDEQEIGLLPPHFVEIFVEQICASSQPDTWKSSSFVNREAYGKVLQQFLVVVVIWLLSCVWFFATPWTAAHRASLSFTISQSLLKLVSTELVMLSNHLICCPPLLPSMFSRVGSLHQVAKVLELQFQFLVQLQLLAASPECLPDRRHSLQKPPTVYALLNC